MKPAGFEHHTRTFVQLNVPHEQVTMIQQAFPELANKMKFHPNPKNLLTAFLVMFSLEQTGKLSSADRQKIKSYYGV